MTLTPAWTKWLSSLTRPARRRGRGPATTLTVETLEPREVMTGTPVVSLVAGTTAMSEGDQDVTIATLTRSGGDTSTPLTVTIQVGDGDPDLFTGFSGTVTFDADVTSIPLTTHVNRDNWVEGTEHHSAILLSGPGYSIGNGQVNYSIADDPPVVWFELVNSVVVENDEGSRETTVVARLRRSGGDLASELYVGFDASGTSEFDHDWDRDTMWVLFSSVSTDPTNDSVDVEFVIEADNAEEPPEPLILTIEESSPNQPSGLQQYTIGATKFVQTTIIDRPPVVTLTPGEAFTKEGESGVRVATLTRSGGVMSEALTVKLLCGGTVESSDYSGAVAAVTFAPEQDTIQLDFDFVLDGIVENQEVLTIAVLENVENGVSRYQHDPSQVASIAVADVSPTAGIEIKSNSEIREDSGSKGAEPGRFRVFLDAPAVLPVTVQIDVTFSAAAGGGDFQGAPGLVTFDVGEHEKFFEFRPNDDSDPLPDTDEIFTLTIVESKYYRIGANPAVFRITDNPSDRTPGCPTCPVIQNSGTGNATTPSPDGASINDGQSNPHPWVDFTFANPTGQTVASMQVFWTTSPTPPGLADTLGDSVWYTPTGGGLNAGQEGRLIYQAPNELETGLFYWQAIVLFYDAQGNEINPLQNGYRYEGTFVNVNLTESPYGNRWTQTGLDQLIRTNRGLLLVRGDGSTAFHPSYAMAGGGVSYGRDDRDSQAAVIEVAQEDETITRIAKDGTRSIFDGENGLLLERKDRFGNWTKFEYVEVRSGTWAIAKTEDSGGRVETYTYANGYLATKTTHTGLQYAYAYETDPNDPSGRVQLKSVTAADPDGAGPGQPQVTTYGYNSGTGLIASILDAEGRETTLSYSAARALTGQVLPCGCPWTYDTPMDDYVAGVKWAGTQTNRITTPALGDLEGTRTPPGGGVQTYTVDPFGRITSETDEQNRTTRHEYNARGDLVKIVAPDPDGGGPLGKLETLYAYDDDHNLLSVTAPDLGKREWTYGGPFDQVTESKDELGRVTKYDLDLQGLPKWVRQIVGGEDAPPTQDRVIPSGDDVVTYFEYTTAPLDADDAPGGLVSYMVDAEGRATSYDYTRSGTNLTVVITRAIGTPEQTVETRTYNGAGQLTGLVDALGRQTIYQYDALGRLTKVTLPDPDLGDAAPAPTIRYEYDRLDRVVKTTDEIGRATTYAYEDDGRRIVATLPSRDGVSPGPQTTTQYDSRGRLVAYTDELQRTTTYEYSLAGDLTAVTPLDPDGPGGPGFGGVLRNTTYETTFAYDLAGRLAKTTAPTIAADVAAPVVVAAPATIQLTEGFATSSTVDLRTVFQDARDADSALRFTIVSNTAAALVESLSIGETGVLAIVWAAGALGNAQIVVRATDSSGNAATTTINATIAANAAFDVVVDNGDAGYAEPSGTWANGSTTAYGSDSRTSATAGAKAQWTLTGLTAGWQEVFVQFPTASPSTAAKAAEYTIKRGATVLGRVTLDQTLAASGWISLGRYFNSGVELTVEAVNAGAGTLRADAARATNSTRPTTATTTVDDGEARYVELSGSWSNSGLSGANGGDSRLSNSAGATARFSFTNLAPGWHEILVENPTDSNSARHAAYTLTSAGATIGEFGIDQIQATPGGFYSVGKFFVSGTTLDVTVQRLSGGTLRADAVRVQAATPPAPNNPIVDDGSSPYALTGSWSASGATGDYGGDSDYASAGAGTSTATWSFASLPAGKYEVWVTWRNTSTRATNAPYTIDTGVGSTTVTVNQKNAPVGDTFGSTTWQSLGVHDFTQGWGQVVLSNNANGSVSADAVRLIRRDAGADAFRVIDASPGENVVGAVDRVLVAFSHPVAGASLTASDVALVGPTGSSIAVTGVAAVSRTQYVVTFAPQDAVGGYRLTLGSGVQDEAGRYLDQDRDGVTNEGAPDGFAVAFHVSEKTFSGASETTFTRDAVGRVLTATDARGGVTTYTYDKAGNVTSVTDALGRQTTYVYDDLQRLIEVIEPHATTPGAAGGVTKYGYDKVSNLTSVTDALGRVTTYRYDHLDRLVELILPDPDKTATTDGPLTSSRWLYAYNEAGELTSETDPLDRVMSYEYDGLGRLVKVTLPDPTPGGDPAPELEYEYDDAGRLTKTIDALDRETTYVYDDHDNLIQLTQPQPAGGVAPVWSWTYDDGGRMLTATDPA